MFLRAFSQFSVLNALVASMGIIASASRDSKTYLVVCTAASHPESCHA